MLDESTTPPPPDDTSPPRVELVDPPPPPPPPSSGPVPTRQGKSKKAKDPAAGPANPPPPFVGGPPVEDGPGAKPAGQGKAKAGATAANPAQAMAVAIDPQAASEQLVTMANALYMTLLNSRYAELIEPTTGKKLIELLAPSKDAEQAQVAALALFMKANMSGGLSPGANLALVFGGTYLAPLAILEPTRMKVHKARRASSPT